MNFLDFIIILLRKRLLGKKANLLLFLLKQDVYAPDLLVAAL
jgi:hypothetical protein